MLIATLGGLALVFPTGETFAGSGAARGTSFSAHSASHPAIARPFFGRHGGHRGNTFLPGVVVDGDYGLTGNYGSPYGEPGAEITPPSADVHYTYTYDVPWDAVHRFPPNVVPSNRPYVSDCTSQTVTVPRQDGAEESANINVIRCY